jgi:type VI secretion system protein ImpJ
MAAHDVHWHEGMFLRPQHFQAGRTHLLHVTALGQKWDLHYDWGLRTIDIDADALGNFRFVVRGLRARLPDGTLIDGSDIAPLSLDLKPALERDSVLTILLAVPQMREGNVNAGTAESGARYLVDEAQLEDENTGANPQAIQIRRFNVRLLLSTQDRAGYTTLPLAMIERSERADGTPQLYAPAKSGLFPYIPPLLACDAWKPLATDILQSIYDRIGKKLKTIAELISARGVSFGSQSASDALRLNQLCTLNEAYALLRVLVHAEGVHPLPAYMELCRLVGQLAVYGDDHLVPDLPPYDHDDLSLCFYTIKNHINALLDRIIDPEYKERTFVGAGLRMEVALDEKWLAKEMFVRVSSPLGGKDCVRLLSPGALNMKIATSDRVDRIFKEGRAGLAFAYCPDPPQALPRGSDMAYFQIKRETQLEEWAHVARELTLAIRLQDKLIVGEITGAETLTIRDGKQTTTMQFKLFVT